MEAAKYWVYKLPSGLHVPYIITSLGSWFSFMEKNSVRSNLASLSLINFLTQRLWKKGHFY